MVLKYLSSYTHNEHLVFRQLYELMEQKAEKQT